MVNGVDAIIAKMTQGDEYGIYRMYHQSIDNIQQFLLLTCTEHDEAIQIGGQMASILKVRFRNELPNIEKGDGDTNQDSSTQEAAEQQPSSAGAQRFSSKPGRITGVGAKVRACIHQGMNDEMIEQDLLDLYLAKGHTRESGLALLRPYIKEIRKAG